MKTKSSSYLQSIFVGSVSLENFMNFVFTLGCVKISYEVEFLTVCASS